jgi:hypothetical protein
MAAFMISSKLTRDNPLKALASLVLGLTASIGFL